MYKDGDKKNHALVVDIGGSNARFALLNDTYHIQHIEILACSQYATLFDALDTYLRHQAVTPKTACLAVAAPIMGDQIKFINNDWQFSIQVLKQRYQFTDLHILNDFEAIAYATSNFNSQDIYQIGTQMAVKDAPVNILGPGTGFGNAIFLSNPKTVISTQGGHSGFAASTPLEIELFSWAIKNNIIISRENFVSGPGIENIYRALCDIKKHTHESLNAADISRIGLEHWQKNQPHICTDVLSCFAALLGSIAGDQALSSGATGGVYIAGGIAKRMVDFIEQSTFRARFEDKGLMSHYVASIPTYIITAEQAGLMGAAEYLHNTRCN